MTLIDKQLERKSISFKESAFIPFVDYLKQFGNNFFKIVVYTTIVSIFVCI